MTKTHTTLAAVLASICFSNHALAQSDQQTPNTTITIQFQYREPMPANGDDVKLRQKIFDQANKDCEVAAKAFGRKCLINNINFGNNVFPQSPNLPFAANANATLIANPTPAAN